MKKETAWSSETLVLYHISTQCHIPDARDLNPHRREKLNSPNETNSYGVTIRLWLENLTAFEIKLYS